MKKLQKTAKKTEKQVEPTIRAPGPDPLKDTRQLSSTLEIPPYLLMETTFQETRAYLELMARDRKPTRIPLNSETVHIGRAPNCEISLRESSVSRRHARVGARGEEYFVEDLDSTNGTYVNGVKVRHCVLRSNDHIYIGEAKFQFVQRKIRKHP
ncbi:MAG: FHA domain-containing protein [Kiritimatiellia bacterium]